MFKRKTRKQSIPELQPKSRRKLFLVISLIVSMLLAGGALAQWTGMLPVTQKASKKQKTGEIAPASLNAASPSKEYIYAGGRLIATEEPGGSGGTPPAAPTNLAATPGNTQVNLTWTAVSGATSYNLKRSTTSGSGYQTIASPTNTSYLNTNLQNGTTYYYVVTAVNASSLESSNSNQASATPNGQTPNYQGYLNLPIDCTAISGWAWDANQPNTPIYVDIYSDNVLLVEDVLADQFRQDLVNAGIGNGYHAFSYPTPASIKNGQPHQIKAKYANTNIDLGNTPQSITCAGGTGNSSLSLNGSTYASAANSTSFNITGAITVEAWIKSTNPSSGQQGIIERYHLSAGGGYALRLSNGKVQFFTLQNGTTFDVVESLATVPTGWHHVAGVFSGSELRIYIDGILSNFKPSGFAPGSGTTGVIIGARGDDATNKFNGLIDEARITAAEIYTGPSFTVQTQLTAVPGTGTKAWWKFDQSGADSSSYGNTATLSGATYSTEVPGGCVSSVASAPTLGSETVWFEDAMPGGASTAGTDPWLWDNRQKASGTHSHTDPLKDGMHQHYFYGVPLAQSMTVNAGDTLVTYVLINPCKPPREIMLQWNDGSTWDHRAYWGENLIEWGTSGSASRYPMGALPQSGQWVRLEVPASSVGLTGATIRGMAFTLFDGNAWFDRTGKITGGAPPTENAAFITQTAPPPQMSQGQTLSVSVTLQNTGTTTWGTGNYKLGSRNPQDNLNWGLNRISLTSPVAPNAQVTFNFSITAPTTPGTYNFQWQMIKDNVTWFGATSPNVAVNVTNGSGSTCPNVSTFSGSGNNGYLEGNGTAANWKAPQGGVVGRDPVSPNYLTLFVAATNNHCIRKVYLEGPNMGQSVLVAGVPGTAGYKNHADPLICKFNAPEGIGAILDANGIVTALLIADTQNHVVRKLTASGSTWIPSLIGGVPGVSGYADGSSVSSLFNSPTGITAVGGFVYCAEQGHLRKIDSSNITSTLATGLANPTGLTANSTGSLFYFTDKSNHSVWKATSAGVVTLVAGTGSIGSADGTGSGASFNKPYHLTWANTTGGEVLYVADQWNHKIRKIVLSSATVTTFAGTGSPGFNDGVCTVAMFNYPRGIAVTPSGDVYVMDTDNHRIRKLQ